MAQSLSGIVFPILHKSAIPVAAAHAAPLPADATCI
jgi:hypothetical protein